MKTLWAKWNRLELHGGMMYRRWESENGKSSTLQLILPDCKKQEVLKHFHDFPTAGHLGVEKTLEKIKQRMLAWYERPHTDILLTMRQMFCKETKITETQSTAWFLPCWRTHGKSRN